MKTKIFRKISRFLEFSNTYKVLHRVCKIASDFDAEVSVITNKFVDAGYAIGFIKSVISDFRKRDENQPIILDWLFEESSKVLFKLPYWPTKKYDVKTYIDRFLTLLEVK